MNHIAGNPKKGVNTRLATQVIIFSYVVTMLGMTDRGFLQAAEEPASSAASAAQSSRDENSRRPTSNGLSVPAKVQRYAERIIASHDSNGDGQLQQSEWTDMQGNPKPIDTNRDGVLTLAEYASHIARFSVRRHIRLLLPESPAAVEEPPLLQPKSAPPVGSPPAKLVASAGVSPGPSPPLTAAATQGSGREAATAPGEGTGNTARPANRRKDLKFFVPAGRLPAGLPSWYHSQDKDGDGQVTLAEYSASLNAGTLAEFNRYDRNRDGVITSDELVGKPKVSRPAKSATPSRSDDTTKSERRRSR